MVVNYVNKIGLIVIIIDELNVEYVKFMNFKVFNNVGEIVC